MTFLLPTKTGRPTVTVSRMADLRECSYFRNDVSLGTIPPWPISCR